MTVGVYVDNANLTHSGALGMRYDVLRAFACRDGSTAIRLNTYVPFDEGRAGTDTAYRHKAWSYQAATAVVATCAKLERHRETAGDFVALLTTYGLVRPASPIHLSGAST